MPWWAVIYIILLAFLTIPGAKKDDAGKIKYSRPIAFHEFATSHIRQQSRTDVELLQTQDRRIQNERP